MPHRAGSLFCEKMFGGLLSFFFSQRNFGRNPSLGSLGSPDVPMKNIQRGKIKQRGESTIDPEISLTVLSQPRHKP